MQYIVCLLNCVESRGRNQQSGLEIQETNIQTYICSTKMTTLFQKVPFVFDPDTKKIGKVQNYTYTTFCVSLSSRTIYQSSTIFDCGLLTSASGSTSSSSLPTGACTENHSGETQGSLLAPGPYGPRALWPTAHMFIFIYIYIYK